MGGDDKVQPLFQIVPTLTRIVATVKTAMSSGNGKTGRPGELLILSCRFPVETLDAQLHARPGSLVPLAADKLFKLR